MGYVRLAAVASIPKGNRSRLRFSAGPSFLTVIQHSASIIVEFAFVMFRGLGSLFRTSCGNDDDVGDY